MPTSNKNLFKAKEQENFMRGNDLNIFIESGCTTKPPKISHTRWKVCQNNPAE